METSIGERRSSPVWKVLLLLTLHGFYTVFVVVFCLLLQVPTAVAITTTATTTKTTKHNNNKNNKTQQQQKQATIPQTRQEPERLTSLSKARIKADERLRIS